MGITFQSYKKDWQIFFLYFVIIKLNDKYLKKSLHKQNTILKIFRKLKYKKLTPPLMDTWGKQVCFS